LGVGKALGAASALVSVGRVVARARARSLGKLAAPLTAALCLTSVPLAIWPVAGLETGLATLFTTEIVLGVTRSPAPRIGWTGCCVALCAWLRPELGPLCLAALIALQVRVGSRALRAWAIGLSGALAVLAWRKLLFDHWLPMSSAAKPPELGHGFDYVFMLLRRPESLLAFGVFLMARRLAGKARVAPRFLWVALLAHGCSVMLVGGDWMPGFRLFCAVAPLFAWCLAQAFLVIWLKRRGLFWCSLLPLLLLRGFVLAQELSVARAAGLTRERTLPVLERLLHEQRGLVAAVDVGLLGEAYSGPILDLGGLTDPRIAYLPGGHLDKRLASSWLRAQNVALFMLHSVEPVRSDALGRVRWFQGFPVERRVLGMPWVAANYRVFTAFPYQPAYHYVLLTPRVATP